MKRYKIASIIMILHGGLMEAGAGLVLGVLFLFNFIDYNSSNQYFSFALPYLQDNLHMMMAMGAIFGIVRVIGAVGLLKNRMWGLVLSVINCVVTMALMIFMLPAGVVDGILACSALILILVQYYGEKEADM